MRLPVLAFLLVGLASLTACSGGGGSTYTPPPTGTLNLTVVDGDTSVGISNARVIVIDGDTGNPFDILTTDASGKAGKVYNTGPLQLKISAEGYGPSPAPGIPPLPVQIVKDQITAISVSLFVPQLQTVARSVVRSSIVRGNPSLAHLWWPQQAMAPKYLLSPALTATT